MNEEAFLSSLRIAMEKSRSVTEEFVDGLPSRAGFIVTSNRSPHVEEDLPLELDEERYPDLDTETYSHPLTIHAPEEVAAFLLRQGKVPVWIDICVDHADANTTYFRLRYCPRFSADERLLRNRKMGAPPFRILGLMGRQLRDQGRSDHCPN